MTSSSIAIWVFIGIGFVGSLALTLSAIFNIIKCVKERSFKHIVLKVQVLFMIANLTFVVYALGISIENHASVTFWNSAPTWIGNLIPFILNVGLVFGKIVSNKFSHNQKESKE
jgi:uncharacterized protein with PQ loop repeat